jgi:hypothetical protein
MTDTATMVLAFRDPVMRSIQRPAAGLLLLSLNSVSSFIVCLHRQLQIRSVSSSGMDDMLPTIGTDVLLNPGHHRAKKITRTNYKAEKFTWVKRKTNWEQFDFDFNNLTRRELLDAVKTVSGDVLTSSTYRYDRGSSPSSLTLGNPSLTKLVSHRRIWR